jgi:hypothetical protein
MSDVVKFRVTIEAIDSEGNATDYVKEEFQRDEVDWKLDRDIEPRYEIGQFSPVGFWDKGYSLRLTAKHVKKIPEAV